MTRRVAGTTFAVDDVRAASGVVNREHWQRIYIPKEAYGGRKATGWITTLFPYIRDGIAGSPTVRNPLLAVGEDLGNSAETGASGSKGQTRRPNPFFVQGLSLDNFPTGLCGAPLTVTLRDRSFQAKQLLGGFTGLTQDQKTMALRPVIGWAVADRDPLDGLIEQLVESHTTSAGARGIHTTGRSSPRRPDPVVHPDQRSPSLRTRGSLQLPHSPRRRDLPGIRATREGSISREQESTSLWTRRPDAPGRSCGPKPPRLRPWLATRRQRLAIFPIPRHERTGGPSRKMYDSGPIGGGASGHTAVVRRPDIPGPWECGGTVGITDPAKWCWSWRDRLRPAKGGRSAAAAGPRQICRRVSPPRS